MVIKVTYMSVEELVGWEPMKNKCDEIGYWCLTPKISQKDY